MATLAPFFYMIVWFNGPSQKELLSIPKQPVEIGCNYIRQVRDVNHVVCYDAEVVNNIDIEDDVTYHTRVDWATPPIWKSIVNPYGTGINSGLLAVILAQKMTKEKIYIIGCDWGIQKHSVFQYEQGSKLRKYSNSMRDVMFQLAKQSPIVVVNNGTPDVRVPVITKFEFLKTIQ